MVLTLSVSMFLAQATVPASTISSLCSQASVKEAPIDLEAVIDEFVQSIPQAGTSGYADPKGDPEGVDALVEGFADVLGGDFSAACEALSPVTYRVALTTDRKTGRDVVLVRERRGEEGYARAWGLYAVSWPPKASSSTLTVEAPHACPNSVEGGCQGGDRFTHLVALKVFREANARYLFINGADRRANGAFEPTGCEQDTSCADVAHQPESPFEKVHETAVALLGSMAKVYQSHRFLSAKHHPEDNVSPGTSGPASVVVSTGTAQASQLAEDVAARIEAEDPSFFHVCLFRSSASCSQLGATRNIQKDHMFGGQFIHVEASDEVVRKTCGASCRHDELAEAIAEAMK